MQAKVITDKLKNFLLVFLIGFSVYQTAELWLRDSLSRNFLHTLLAEYSVSPSTNIKNFVLPSRIITSIGNNRFDVMYTGIPESQKRNLVDYAISIALNEGEYVATYHPIDFNRFLSYRSIIYEYRFNMPIDTFTEVLANNSDMVLGFNYLNSIIIVPSPNASNLIYFIFIDNENNTAYEFRVTRGSLHEALSREIQNSHRNLSSYQIYYVSSELMGFDFGTNIFLPRWRGQEYEHKKINIINNYYYETNPSLSTVGRNLYMFFENQAAVWANNRDDIFIYSDENIVVQYFQNGILEYINYRQGTTQGNLLSDFDVAKRFISRDTMIINEFFLAGFSEKEHERVFYFDYTINNFPIIFTEAFKKHMGITDLNHAIEVTVQNGIVTRYRKIAYSFEIYEDSLYKANIDLITVVDGISGESISNISFGYNIFKIDRASRNNLMHLEWVIDIKD